MPITIIPTNIIKNVRNAYELLNANAQHPCFFNLFYFIHFIYFFFVCVFKMLQIVQAFHTSKTKTKKKRNKYNCKRVPRKVVKPPLKTDTPMSLIAIFIRSLKSDGSRGSAIAILCTMCITVKQTKKTNAFFFVLLFLQTANQFTNTKKKKLKIKKIKIKIKKHRKHTIVNS